MKRIMTIQDISCVGKCSLTVALPIISAMGVETAVIPTAVFSTHTMFTGYTCTDLTDQIRPIAEHWKKEHFTFEAIYTGYLGSFEQISLSGQLMDEFKRGDDTLIFVDPVMADNGSLYPGFDMAYAQEMKKLCSRADMIVPNLTEASLLTGLPYRTDCDEAYYQEMIRALSQLGPKYVILTGVSSAPGRVGALGMETATGETFRYETERQPMDYHGTGDIFSSTLLGAMMNDLSLSDALAIACEYTARTIAVTIADPISHNYGVNFEATLPWLMEQLKKRPARRASDMIL